MASPWRSPPESPVTEVSGVSAQRREAHRRAHQLGRHAPHLADLQEPEAPADRAAHEDVAPERQLLGEGTLLVDGLDAEGSRPLDIEVLDGLAAEEDLALIRLVVAR